MTEENLPTREEVFAGQRAQRGFDSAEIWDLQYHHAQWILPRIKAFREEHCGCPINMTPEEWNKIIDKIIKGFELIAADHWDDFEEQQEAVNLFAKYYFGLWW